MKGFGDENEVYVIYNFVVCVCVLFVIVMISCFGFVRFFWCDIVIEDFFCDK